MRNTDLINVIGVTWLALGTALFVWGSVLEPPSSVTDLVLLHFGDWTPGFITDGVLLLLINHVIKLNERKRVITQAGSQSNEFALDALDRCREEGWLFNGVMKNAQLSKGRLSGADLSEGQLAGADLSYADLSRTDLSHADLTGALLTGANLSNADLRWANLSDAVLRWADLRGAQIDGAAFLGIDSHYASIDPEHSEFPGFENAVVGGFLTPFQIDLVTSSFQEVLKLGEAAFVRFYEILFTRAPEVRPLFSVSKERQARKFLQSLRVIVDSLDSIEKAAPVLQRLGERHRRYGVKPEYFDVVGPVLLETLEDLLGKRFTPEVRDAWLAAYQLIASSMNEESHDTSTKVPFKDGTRNSTR